MKPRSLLVLLPMAALLAIVFWPSTARPGGTAGTVDTARAPTPTMQQAAVAREHVQAIESAHARLPAGTAATDSFHGVVLDHAREPFEGALVTLSAALRLGEARQRLASTRSDAAGRFQIAAHDGWPTKCVLRARTEASRTSGYSVEAGRDVELVLSPPAELTPVVVAGVVTDIETGWGLAAAHVLAGDDETTTDEVGRFELSTKARGGRVRLSARCEGYESGRASVELDDKPLPEARIELVKMGEMRVQVVDAETDAPIENAELIERSHRGVGRTDAMGVCNFSMPRRGRQNLKIRAPGYCAVEWRWRAEELRRGLAKIPLSRGVLVTGRVVDERDAPIPEAATWLDSGDFFDGDVMTSALQRNETPGSLSLDLLAKSIRADNGGRFEIRTFCRDGPTIVRAEFDSDPDLVGAASAVLDLSTSGTVDCGVLVLVRGGVISGTVLRNGQPCPGTVVWHREDGQIGGESGITDAGRYELDRVVPGARRVTFFEPNIDEASARGVAIVEAGEQTSLDFAFAQSTATISGRVTRSDGAPISGVKIYASSDDEGASPTARDITDAEGQYVLTVRDTGRYHIRALHADVRRVHRRVSPGSSEIDFTALAFGQMRIRVFDRATREPIGGMDAHDVGAVWQKLGEGSFRHLAELTFVEPGLAEIELPIGTVNVVLGAPALGYRLTSFEGLVVPRDPQPAVRDMPLEHGVDVCFVIDDPEGLRAAMGARRLFVFERSRVDAVRPRPAGEGSPSMVDVHEWIQSAQIWSCQHIPLRGEPRVVIRGLAPGSFTFVVLPEGIALEPAGFSVGEDGAEVQVRWRRS